MARKVALQLQRGQKSPAGGAFCQYALKSGTLIVNDTEVASDHYWSVERESTDKPTTSAWVADEYVRDYVAAAETADGWF